jgi:hypothetical protein
VATCIAVAAVTGTKLAVRFGNKQVVATGLLLMSIGFLWVSFASPSTPYLEIVGQMVFLGLGLGFTTAPATEAVMGSVPAAKAGQGSAVNDATREVGGTLGIAVIGSVFASVYSAAIARSDVWSEMPGAAREAAKDGLGLALGVLERLDLPASAVGPLATAAREAFMSGLSVGCRVAAAVTLCGSVAAAALLPSQPGSDDDGLAARG